MDMPITSPLRWLVRLVIAAVLGATLAGPVLLGSQLTIVHLEGRPLTQPMPAPAHAPAPREGPAPPLTAQTVGVWAWLAILLVTLFAIVAAGFAFFAGFISLVFGFVPLLIAAVALDLGARRVARMRTPRFWILLGIAVAAPWGPFIESRLFSSHWCLGWPLNLLPAALAGAVVGIVVYGVLRGSWRVREFD